MRTIGARTTEFLEVPLEEAITFVEANKKEEVILPGSNPRAYGLYLREELVAVAIFSSPRAIVMQSRYGTELLTIVFKESVHVSRGEQKFIKGFLGTGPWDVFYRPRPEEDVSTYENSGLSLRELEDDRIYEWRNPKVGFYTYKITSSKAEGYYIGRHVLRNKNLTLENALNDGYMGSGATRFRAWVASVGVDSLQKEILGFYRKMSGKTATALVSPMKARKLLVSY